MSSRYQAEICDSRLRLSDEMFALAYLATKLPATFAAVQEILESAPELQPDFEQKSLLGVGSGPGMAMWAA